MTSLRLSVAAVLVLSPAPALAQPEIIAKLTALDPATGRPSDRPVVCRGTCPLTVRFAGRLASARGGTLRYRFVRSDGAKGAAATVTIAAGGSAAVQTEWTLGRAMTGWVAIEVLHPRTVTSNHAEFEVVCEEASAAPTVQPPALRGAPRISPPATPQTRPAGKATPKESAPGPEFAHEARPAGEAAALEPDTDRPGGDYRDFDLDQARPELCRDACVSDSRCRAFTYVKPAVQSPRARCWLKTFASAAVANSCCVSGVVAAERPRPAGGDRDEDGIPDDVENELLRKYSPYYLFSKKDRPALPAKNEVYRPADPVVLARWAQLRHGSWQDGGSEPTLVRSCGNPDESYHLDPPEVLLTCVRDPTTQNPVTDLRFNPTRTGYYLNIKDDLRSGPDSWDQVANKGNAGTFGHVVPAARGYCKHDYPYQVLGESLAGLYKIEYWQYFGYSGQDVYGADHEGDWATVQLWHDPRRDALVLTCHFTHGKGICFDMRTYTGMTARERMKEYHGPNHGKKCTVPGAKEWIEDKVLGAQRTNPSAIAKRYPPGCQNNHVRFFDETHVAVYFERDGHEAWPSEKGSCSGANEHNGKGRSYLTRNVPNLGEVDRPSGPSAEIVLLFNGYWGCFHHHANSPPPGPALHCEWTWPPDADTAISSGACNSCEF